jgi:hypothetical protein
MLAKAAIERVEGLTSCGIKSCSGAAANSSVNALILLDFWGMV